MLYISYEDQNKIKRRMKRLPEFLRGEVATIMAFETVATLILTYGVCISIYKHPIIDKKPDPCSDIFIACFYYFGLSVSAPFTGGHMNPATTISFHLLKKNKNMIYYFIAQLLGASIAGALGHFFFDVTPASYTTEESILSCFYDTIGEAVGLFIVLFFAFLVTQTKYATSDNYGYMVVSIMVFMGRAFSFRKACINPVIGLVFQVIVSIKQSNYILIAYSLPVIIGPTIGAVLAYYAFMKLYKPLLEEVKEAKEIQNYQNYQDYQNI